MDCAMSHGRRAVTAMDKVGHYEGQKWRIYKGM